MPSSSPLPTTFFVVVALASTSAFGRADTQGESASPVPVVDAVLEVSSCPIPGRDGETMRCGDLMVWENRTRRSGRRIPIHFVVLEATGSNRRPDPLVLVAGGPGQDATSFAPFLVDAPMRAERDILLIDQRGTGGSNPLHCDLPGNDDNLQGFLHGAFPPAAAFDVCQEELSKRADLTQYSSIDAAHDMDAVRAALGYEQLNLNGGSYGTRASLTYMRAYPKRVRTAVLNGVAPLGFENPLYHARGAQRALDKIFAECRHDPACLDAFGDPAEDFRAIVAQLRNRAARVSIAHPATNDPVSLDLDEGTFYEGLRTFMYATPQTRRLPMILHQAAQGELAPLLRAALLSTRGIQEALHWGMLLSVTCAEDVDRIDEDEIVRETKRTFLGDARIREQKAACAHWPRSHLPDDWAEEVSVAVPTLVLSGTIDPVTGPEWGELAARHLPNSLHIVAPGAHGVGGPCIDAIRQRFLERGTVTGLDTSCVADMKLPPFVTADEG